MTAQPAYSQDTLSRKRQRAESVYPRLRSVTACTLCRGRKTKCDNARPSCGFCLSIQAQCVYDEARSDFSNYDSASLHIIDQLKQLGTQMEKGFRALSMVSPTDANSRQKAKARHSALAPVPVVESILEWGIFDSLELELQGRSLAVMHGFEQDFAYTHSRSATQNWTISDAMEPFDGIPPAGADIKAAVQSFLRNVHSKNPIVEPDSLEEAANNCQINGFGTDGMSALVAIACALGHVASPYSAPSEITQALHVPDHRAMDRRVAQAFFTKGRSIASVLPASLLTIQCLFFCGVYEMYIVRPVAACLQFSQASLQLRLLLLAGHLSAPEEVDSPRGRLIQRLYWSCMQSESELANELRLKSSGLEDLQFPHAFPCPPAGPDIRSDASREEMFSSWMYYLSETSLRRISDDIAWTLYEQSPTTWLQDVALIQAQSQRLDENVEAWMANLPQALRVESKLSECTNELGLHIRSRYLQCRSWIYRPFLYIMLHATPATLAEHREDVEPLAYKCLVSCMDCIEDVTFHHRHHGTWYMVRVAFACALLLLAAAKVRNISMPPGWENAIRRTSIIISHWKTDCRDLQVSAQILDALRRQVGA